ncbi:MAG: fimbrillin family protein [Prevotella sp.]|jgi:hypothetical protein|nr:fimbrillin family protein [Prevotella sp.]
MNDIHKEKGKKSRTYAGKNFTRRLSWRITVVCPLTALAVALILPSCTSEDLERQNLDPAGDMAIGFTSDVNEPSTRATMIETEYNLQSAGFNVLAATTGASLWSAAKANAAPDFMYDQPVAWKNSPDPAHWEYAPLKYWPGKTDGANYDKVSFFAYTPCTEGICMVGTAQTDKGAPKIVITLPDEVGTRVDVCADQLVDETFETAPVKFQFRHLLSCINFTGLLVGEYDAQTSVHVTSLKLKYAANAVKKAATYTFADADHAEGALSVQNTYHATMGTGEEIAPAEYPPGISADHAEEINAHDKFLFELPQTVAAGALQLEVTWTVVTGETIGLLPEYPQTATNRTATLSLPTATWEAGKKYSYQLNFSLTKVEFGGISVSPWGEGEEPENCSVIYMANDGTGANIVDDNYWINTPGILAGADIFSNPAGAVLFNCWTTQPDGSGDYYGSCETITPVGNMTLYAQWRFTSDFTYTGNVQICGIPVSGTYKLECWGGAGNNPKPPRAGGYVSGTIHLEKNQALYVYVGGMGSGDIGGWNGGGSYGGGDSNNSRSGGGATDIRLLNSVWNNPDGLNSRILVAGGGGSMSSYGGYYDAFGYAGGLNGSKGAGMGNTQSWLNAITDAMRAKGGTQTAGGAGSNNNTGFSGGFGFGGTWGGGSGYYGGGGGQVVGDSRISGGGGGSSFISGMTGCVAINPTNTNNPRLQDNGAEAAKNSLNFTTSVFKYSPTWNDGDEITFTNCSMIDGAGYEWNTGEQASIAGTMPNPSGGAMTGNTGHGYARISLVVAD